MRLPKRFCIWLWAAFAAFLMAPAQTHTTLIHQPASASLIPTRFALGAITPDRIHSYRHAQTAHSRLANEEHDDAWGDPNGPASPVRLEARSTHPIRSRHITWLEMPDTGLPGASHGMQTAGITRLTTSASSLTDCLDPSDFGPRGPPSVIPAA